MATPDRPKFFCTRPDGSLTALLAADDLPSDLFIRGLPRNLSAGDTQGMTSCGLVVPRSEPWAIEAISGFANPDIGKGDLTEMHALMIKILGDSQVPAYIREGVQAILHRGIDKLAAPSGCTAMSPLAQNFSASPRQGRLAISPRQGKHQVASSKKEYCSYWIRHGECDYSQQGCLYKHEMPLEASMLEKLGLRDIPRWYRDAHNVPSLLQQGHSRPQLTIADQPASRVVSNSTPNVVENMEAKVSATTGAFFKTPPQGPAHYGNGKNNGHGHGHGHGTNSPRGLPIHGHSGAFNGNRNGNRSASANGRNGHHDWKNSRGGRNRISNASPGSKSFMSDRSAGRSPRVSPNGKASSFGFGQFGELLNHESMNAMANSGYLNRCLPTSPGLFVAPEALPQSSLLEDGNAHHRMIASKVKELGRIDENVRQSSKHHSRPSYGHVSNPSTDGGVMLPKEMSNPFAPSHSGPRQGMGVGASFCHDQIHNSVRGARPTNSAGPMSLNQLFTNESVPNVPLSAIETPITWGVVGHPTIQGASPEAGHPAGPSSGFGCYPVKHSY